MRVVQGGMRSPRFDARIRGDMSEVNAGRATATDAPRPAPRRSLPPTRATKHATTRAPRRRNANHAPV
ncbi:hypothetical protein WS83_05045 [Burkholderia sp. MSMB2042]|nr:hypothetical protein WS78_11195 [Burkholderia savannae]KVG47151.1 hypothetical protein WS77_28720 [Burkholderia sp. MSMB0265]KVG77923.1 hypothetical protein WS81_17290 [Burkholderia sp. MSMB2040]KVG95223.1 hypothetical protein WS83_05045 [Burkholderia sp. MSMB2042]KVG99386.1 hypothetical protein WS82_24550 [Burkholderia sp. MSMB2041]KVK88419.1 hypothetical protein WS91_29915 [Burkholderia sp. MSMB1498]